MIVKTNIIQFKNIRKRIAFFWVKMQWETPKGENKWCFCGIHCVHVRIISVARKFIIIILQLHVVTCRPFIFSGWMSCTAKKTNHPPIYCTNRSAVIITIVIILHSPFRLYARYLLYVSCIFRCICELASFGGYTFSCYLYHFYRILLLIVFIICAANMTILSTNC